MALARLTRHEVEAAVAAAVAAPSVLNTQPWLFRSHGDVIDLFGDPSRVLRVTDPVERALCISCGAALMNLRLAVEHMWREPEVELLPTPGDDQHLARVRIGGPLERADERPLYSEIPRRRTSRLPFSTEPVPTGDLDHLQHQAEAEGAQLHVLTGWELQDVVKLVQEADRAQRADPEVRREVREWLNRPGHPGEGLTSDTIGPRPRDSSALVRDFAMGARVETRESATFEDAPALAVLLTRWDTRRDWLLAGQALERVLLAATARGLATSLLTQAAEVPSLRWLLRSPSLGPGHPHALVRLGYGPRGPASPRRPVRDVLAFAAPTGQG